MRRELGIARCGLACCACHENASCPGCASDGCKDREWCKNRACTLQRGLRGCWECADFPCEGGMLQKPRIRAFAAYARAYGTDALMDRLERNERAGVVYHYPGELVGDYDCFDTQADVWDALENGLRYRGLLVKESLKDETILDLIDIEKAEIWRTDSTPRYWTAVWFTSRDPRFPDKLAEALTGSWYVDMRLGGVKLLAFAGRVMRYRVGDAEGRRQAEAYARELGVPEAQLDWED